MKLNKYLQEDNGGESSLRLIMAWWCIGVFVVWAIISLWKEALMDLPETISLVIMAILTAKVWQKGKEKPVDDKPEE